MTTYSLVQCTLDIRLLSAIHIGTGYGLAGLVDERTTTGPYPGRAYLGNIPYIPGSSLKGRLRLHASQLVQHDWFDSDAGALLLLDLFGSSQQSGRLVFADAHLTEADSQIVEPQPTLLTLEQRAHVAISRVRRSALAQMLMHLEVAAPGLQLITEVHGWLPRKRASHGLALLTAAICLLRQIGGHKGRGLGNVHIRPQSVLLDNQPQQLHDLWELL